MNSLQILSFVGFTLLVAIITWWKVRKTDTGSQQGYFLAGRSLKAPVIAASLMLTNLSTEQLVGLSGQAYKSGMSVMGWEVTSAVTLIFLALIFLPRYLKRGIATIPDFLEERYDKTTRIIIDFCFLIATGVCFLPIVLYSGALALNSLFHVGESLQISHGAAIWLLVILLGLAGILYAVIGGLRAMAVADSINGIGLVIGGLMVPIFGLIAMGKGSFMQGIEQLTTVHAEKLNSVGGPTDPLPIGAAFTGLILVNTFYWCTNQGIVQRTLASKSLAEGQKGALLTAVLKMLDPLVLVLPGLIAFHLYQDLPKADMAYPTLVNNVLPVPLVGFFGAVLFGAVISTFNGFLNSASTLFSMGIYRRIINQNAEPHHPFTCPVEYLEKYADFYYELGEKSQDDLANKPEHHRLWAQAMPSPVGDDGLYHHPLYFACNDFVDDQIGRVINALTPEQRENTWVIYTSDHGEMMGAHKLISKGAAMYDDITRIPLIIRSPQGERRQVDTPVSHIDLLPTMMALADIEKPEILPGENILAVKEPRGVMVEFNRYEIEHDSFGGFIPVRCWVTDDFKLVLNLFTSDELYDRRNDSNEMHNLIDDIRFADVRRKMHDALLDYMDKIRDPFRSYQWSLRPWRKDARPRWMGAFRPRPQDGYSPVVRDYDTGLPTQGVKVEEKKQKF